MSDFPLKSMRILGLLVLLLFVAGCREKPAPPAVAEPEVVTMAFKMPKPEKTKKVAVREDKAGPAPAVSNGGGGKQGNPVAPVDLLIPANAARTATIPEYSGEGRINPFLPLIRAEKKTSPEEEGPKKPTRILTPLEKLDYSQMKLVAIVGRATGEYSAMVQESSGKGYVVKPGIFIGRNGGKVTEILQDRIIVVERVKDYKGDMITRRQEIKLNKTEDGGL